MKCKYCYSEIPNNSAFCKYCGSILDSSSGGRVQASANNGQVAAPVKKHRFRKFLLFILVSFLVLSLVAYALIYVFFPPKRYYQSELVTVFGDDTTVSYTNHRGFETERISNGTTLFQVDFDGDGKISNFTFYKDGETVALYTSTQTVSSGMTSCTATSDNYNYKIQMEYNSQNRLTSFEFFEGDKPSNVYAQMTYNTFGIMTQAEIHQGNEKQIRKYDYKGDLISEVSYINGTLISTTEYTDGVLRKSSVATDTETKDGQTYVDEYMICSYDENGLQTSFELFNSSDELMYHYDIESKTDSEVVYVVKSVNDDDISEKHRYTLNGEGKVTCIYDYDADGNSLGRAVFSYDREGNLQSLTRYDEDDNEIFSEKYTWKKQPLFLLSK